MSIFYKQYFWWSIEWKIQFKIQTSFYNYFHFYKIVLLPQSSLCRLGNLKNHLSGRWFFHYFNYFTALWTLYLIFDSCWHLVVYSTRHAYTLVGRREGVLGTKQSNSISNPLKEKRGKKSFSILVKSFSRHNGQFFLESLTR